MVSKNILLEGLNQFHGTSLTTLNFDVGPNTFGKVTKHKKQNTQDSQEVSRFPAGDHKATRNRSFFMFFEEFEEKNQKLKGS